MTRNPESWFLRVAGIKDKISVASSSWLFQDPIDETTIRGYRRFISNMRAVVQRVSEASVTIAGQVQGAIRTGLLVLVAVEETDAYEDIEWLSGKLVRLRIFNDDQGQMNRSIMDVEGDILVISQFTLYASIRRGNRPSYSRAASPETARSIYQGFVRKLSEDLGKPVQTGWFGATMSVQLVNDGPVTILMDTKERE